MFRAGRGLALVSKRLTLRAGGFENIITNSTYVMAVAV